MPSASGTLNPNLPRPPRKGPEIKPIRGPGAGRARPGLRSSRIRSRRCCGRRLEQTGERARRRRRARTRRETPSMFVSSDDRPRGMRRSTSGSGTRSSTGTQIAKATAAKMKRPSGAGEPQPQLGPSLDRDKKCGQPIERRAAPRHVDARRSLDRRLGYEREHATSAASDDHGGDHEEPAPREVVDDQHPRAARPRHRRRRRPRKPRRSRRRLRSARKLIVDDREASGKTAPPVPWTIRKAISDQIFHAAAAPMQPTRKTARLITSSRSLPCWSPSLPISGVSTAELSRKPVKIQVDHVVVVCRSSCR